MIHPDMDNEQSEQNRTDEPHRLMWVFANGHIWHKDFLTEAEAIAYSEFLELDVDPNIKTWSLVPLSKKDGQTT